MTDKVIKCNTCGYPLNVTSITQKMIKCPKCGVVNVIETHQQSANDKGKIIGGIPFTANEAEFHKTIISWIFKNHALMPHDIFQGLRITGIERLCVPCYLFECNATIRYSYEIGNMREHIRQSGNSLVTEQYPEFTHQNDVFDYCDCVMVPGNSEYRDILYSFYNNINISDLVDLEHLNNPSNVKELAFNVQVLNALKDVKSIIAYYAQAQIVDLLKNYIYKDLQIRDNFRIDYGLEPKQIFLPLVHIKYVYKEQTGDIWFSGDAKKNSCNNFPVSYVYTNSRKELLERKPKPFVWGIAIFLIATFILLPIRMFYEIPILLVLLPFVLVPLGVYLLYRLIDLTSKINEGIKQLDYEHELTFSQFLQKKMPLNGVLQKGLIGKSEAFPS